MDFEMRRPQHGPKEPWEMSHFVEELHTIVWSCLAQQNLATHYRVPYHDLTKIQWVSSVSLALFETSEDLLILIDHSYIKLPVDRF
jgi:hypothetical protein